MTYSEYMPNSPKIIEGEILKFLKDEGLSINWLAKKLSLTQHHLTKVIRVPGHGTEKRNLSPKLLEQINAVLGTDFKLPSPV